MLHHPPETEQPRVEFVDNDYCFACGSRNPLGLHLTFVKVNDSLETRLKPMPHWQGWQGVVHGGLLATILDDLMSNHLFKLVGIKAVTAEVTLRFHSPVPVQEELVFRSSLLGNERRVWRLSATCCLAVPDSKVLTSATGRFIELSSTV